MGGKARFDGLVLAVGVRREGMATGIGIREVSWIEFDRGQVRMSEVQKRKVRGWREEKRRDG